MRTETVTETVTKGNNRDKKVRVVRSRRVAFELRKLGYRIVSVEPNRYNPKYDVYFFADKPGLEEDMYKLCQEQKQRRESYDKRSA